jgi:hypothetical protein
MSTMSAIPMSAQIGDVSTVKRICELAVADVSVALALNVTT